LLLVVRHAGGLRPKWNPALTRSILRQSFPFALLVLLMSFYYRTDSIMLERMLPDGALQAGIYAQGFRFFEAFNMLGFLLAGLLLPMYSRMLKQQEDVGPLTGMALRLVLAGTVAVAVVGSMRAQQIMDLRYHEHTELSAPAFAVLIWCFVWVCISYIFGTLLTASGDLKTLNRLAASAMVLNIGLNLVLIPRYHALGAAWASFITQGLMAGAQVAVAAKRYRLKAGLAPVLGLLAYALLLAAVSWLLLARGVALLPAVAAVAGLGAVGALGTGLVPLRSLQLLLQRRMEA